MNTSCIVIGAGIAGLMAAHHLSQHGVQVTVLDKGRGVGGRLATRRLGTAVFDHGAQYFTVRDERFRSFVQAWQQQGIVKIWSQGFHAADGTLHHNGENRHYGREGMTQIAKTLAQPLRVQLETCVNNIDWYANQWIIGTKLNQTFTADMLIITTPAEQALKLISAGNYALPAAARTALQAITYDPCFAVMALLDHPTQIPAPGGMWINSPNIHWIADNHQKGVSKPYGVTIHATPDFTRQHWETDHDELARKLLSEVEPWIGGKVMATSTQRWKYSQPTVLHPERCLALKSPAPLIFAGDGFGEARVEGAALSGMAAADQLWAWVEKSGDQKK